MALRAGVGARLRVLLVSCWEEFFNERSLSAYALATRCPVLTEWMVVSAYELATQCPVLALCMLMSAYALSGTDTTYAALCLRACYAMSGTDIAYGDICVRAGHAASGTDIAYAATRALLVSRVLPAVRAILEPRYASLLSSYARAMPCPVLPWRMLLPARYAMSSTDMLYAPTGTCMSRGRTDPGYSTP
eukprot:2368973-Rhodomonas_salina.3